MRTLLRCPSCWGISCVTSRKHSRSACIVRIEFSHGRDRDVADLAHGTYGTISTPARIRANQWECQILLPIPHRPCRSGVSAVAARATQRECALPFERAQQVAELGPHPNTSIAGRHRQGPDRQASTWQRGSVSQFLYALSRAIVHQCPPLQWRADGQHVRAIEALLPYIIPYALIDDAFAARGRTALNVGYTLRSMQ